MLDNRLQLQFLPPEALDRIEETAYRLLDEVGISLQHAGATAMLHGHGCRVDNERVYIPRDVVDWALGHVTPHRQWYRVDGSAGFVFGDGQIRFHNSGGPPFINDLDSGERRHATMQDIADITRVLDALPNVDVVIPLFGPQDVPPELLAVASTDVMLRHTRKPISSAPIEKPEHVPYVVDMAAACCGGMDVFRERPTMSISVSPVSPLTFTEDVAASIIAIARARAPFHSLPAPSLGATGPVTMAGALAQQHAEVLASFVITASASPGAPVVYCSRISPIDLRTAVSSWGGPEVGMAGACATQLAQRLGSSHMSDSPTRSHQPWRDATSCLGWVVPTVAWSVAWKSL
jgi:trimethylamine--corrinoid protein Co-methyltransferase